MADIVFIAITLAFFAVCARYIRWCDSIMGGEATSATAVPESSMTDSVDSEVAA